MTIIAAFDDGLEIWMGSDDFGIAPNFKTKYTSKLIPFDNYCIGFSWSYRIGDIIRELNSLPSKIYNILGVRKIRDIIREEIIQTGANSCDHDDDENTSHPVSLLITCPSGIYEIQSNYSILKATTRYDAIGAGQEIAIGALYYAKKCKESARIATKLAIEAATYHCTNCGGKTHLYGIRKYPNSSEIF